MLLQSSLILDNLSQGMAQQASSRIHSPTEREFPPCQARLPLAVGLGRAEPDDGSLRNKVGSWGGLETMSQQGWTGSWVGFHI